METNIKTAIEELVTILDHKLAGIPLEVPKNLQSTRLLQSTVDKYLPPYKFRCQTVAYSILFLNLKQTEPNIDKESFITKFLVTKLGYDAFLETMAHLETVLPVGVTVERLRELVTDGR